MNFSVFLRTFCNKILTSNFIILCSLCSVARCNCWRVNLLKAVIWQSGTLYSLAIRISTKRQSQHSSALLFKIASLENPVSEARRAKFDSNNFTNSAIITQRFRMANLYCLQLQRSPLRQFLQPLRQFLSLSQGTE